MKAYKSYLDKITLDPALKEKIMASTIRRNSRVFQLAGAVAFIAVLIITVWILPIPAGFFTVHYDLGSLLPYEPYVVLTPDEPENDSEPINDPQDPTPEPLPPILPTLVFNPVELPTSARMIGFPDNYFYHRLTDEQISAIFPGLDLTLSGTVHYRSDGAVWFVSADEYERVGERRRFTGTTIQLGMEGAPLGGSYLFYDGAPIISEVHGIYVKAFVYGWNDEFFRAEFMLGDISYLVQTRDSSGKSQLTEIVNLLILNGAADMSSLADPIIPELRNERLTLSEARRDIAFGALMPSNIPSDFVFETAIRRITTSDNSLFAGWSRGVDTIHWFVRTPLESDLWNIVSINDRHKYDVSLYPIPWADSVPDDLHYYFQSPVFLAEEFTLDIIQARTRQGIRGLQTSQLGILLDDVIIVISASGISPEQLWNMLPVNVFNQP